MAFTRAASAASSHRAKQELVRVLFGPKYYRQGREAHRMLDHSIYTHSQLKSAYLERLQELHPDKRRNNHEILSHNNNNNSEDAARDEFISLQEAWDRYEEVAKALIKVSNGSREANFTLFGVGCSFSDSPEEQERRNEITDQACRGWFSAGELGVGDESSDKAKQKTKQSSLLDDDMFVTEEMDAKPTSTGKRKSLIDHMVRPQG
uniref:J domain-containing protein n=1 Tax=Amphora coffeiformis TaxID=265554 RepID=A0A7S3P2L5_9STRA|mmetsp:Transcript_10299/g.19762  ORF Transcript_10299/g.19762 Transcript_10299/m.19762 type:complete len:206 (+) Transcript_10299:185-802(+)|eukprot:scaffold4241_cov164-Amphora_coffeaeformis.AAC.2